MAETKKKNQTGNALPLGTKLKNGRYVYTVKELLGQGNYGFTYKATAQVRVGNIPRDFDFAIKENFAKQYCSRMLDGITMNYPEKNAEEAERDLHDFLAEGKTLERICNGHSNIVNVNETFEENNTAYYVMEFIEGGNLCDLVKCKGCLSENEALSIIVPIIDAVKHLHQNHRLHLDIKPENIMLRNDGFPILIDFGVTLHFNVDGSRTGTSKDRSSGFSDGYAPMEQYLGVNKFAPAIDVYALGATLYYMLVGKDPAKASDISAKKIEISVPANISLRTRSAILHAMNKLAEDRTQTTNDFLNELKEQAEFHDSYRLSIKISGNGTVLRNNKELKNGSVYQVKNDSLKSVSIIPDEGYIVESIRLNNEIITDQLVNNKLTLNRQEGDIELLVAFVNIGTKKYNKKEVTISSSGNGNVANGAIVVRNSSRSFQVNKGSSFTFSISSDAGYRVKSLKVNDKYVTSRISNNRYTINDISADTLIEIVFGEDVNVTPLDLEPKNIMRNVLLVIGAVLLIVIPIRLVDSSSHTADLQGDNNTSVEYVTDYVTFVNSSDFRVNYTGSIVDGVPNDDNATIKYSDSDPSGRDQYIGSVQNGIRNGSSATLLYKNGDKYEGSFIDDSFDEGTYTIKKDGSYFKGKFHNDQPYNGTWYYKSGEKMSNVVNGIEK